MPRCARALFLLSAAFAALSKGTISVLATDYTGAWGTSSAEQDLVTSLPSVGNLSFPLHAGYIVVNETAGRALYYTFTPAKTAPDTAPLLLWLTGGPGCSSTAYGFGEEIGPFQPVTSHSIRANPYPWSDFASVITLDSIPFVGFSYSLTRSDRFTGDGVVSADTYTFLVQWFKRYPTYANKSFYIVGESYGGRYIPQAAIAVLQGNKVAPAAERINLKGVSIGNGATDPYYDALGLTDYWHSHDMLGDEVYAGIIKNCDFSKFCIWADLAPPNNNAKSCPAKEDCCTYYWLQTGLEGDEYASEGSTVQPIQSGDVNIYDMLSEWPCPASLEDLAAASAFPANASSAAAAAAAAPAAAGRRRSVRGQAHQLARHTPVIRGSAARLANPMRRSLLTPGSEPYTYNSKYPTDCMEGPMEGYYNRPDVQLAMHANQTYKSPFSFTGCSSAAANVSYARNADSMLPLYRSLIAAGVKMLIYSGDGDAIVPSTGTRYGLTSLKLKVLLQWAPWYSCTGNVGGRRVRYQGLDLFTVRDSGHEVPWFQGERASFMLKNYLGIPHNCSYRCLDCNTGKK